MEGKKTTIVTGAAGFIGMHLCEHLLRDDYRVIGIDNLNEYYSVALKKMRLDRLYKYKNFEFIQADIADYLCLDKIFNEFYSETVWHLAAQAGVRYSLINPQAYERSNLAGFLNILECCRHHSVVNLIYASSSSVYGANKKIPFSETDVVDNPVSLYAATKKANELLAHSYSNLYGINTIGLRFFTVYGPWGRPDMAPMLFADAISNDKVIRLFNNGDMKRDFTYIDDIITGMIGILGILPRERRRLYEIYNIGNNHPEQLLDFVAFLEKFLMKSTNKEYLPMQDGDVPTTYADISKLRAVCNYQPKTMLAQGLSLFVEWYKEYRRRF